VPGAKQAGIRGGGDSSVDPTLNDAAAVADQDDAVTTTDAADVAASPEKQGGRGGGGEAAGEAADQGDAAGSGADDTANGNANANSASSDDTGATTTPNLIVIVIPAVVGLLFIVGGAIIFCRKQGNRKVPHQAPHIVENAAYADPETNHLHVPYGDDAPEQVGVPIGEDKGLALPVQKGAARGLGADDGVQPVEEMYEEADLKRAPIYDAGRLAGAASHALRDQRRASQLIAAAAALEDVDYEEIAESTAAPTTAPRSKRQNTVSAADWCHRAAPAGGTCKNPKVSGRTYCISHLCEHPGCTQSKSSSVTACPEHLQAGVDADEDTELDC
jgi:hypothetical protein